MHLLHETPWIKLWQTATGPYADSKLRTHPTPPDPAVFLAAWDAADPCLAPLASARTELEAAFAFYPYELTADIDRILSHIAATDPAAAARMRANHFTADSDTPESLSAFLEQLAAHYGADIPMTLLGENLYYAAHISDLGLHLDSKISSIMEMPAPESLRALLATIPPTQLLYRRAAALVADNPWLIHPHPGEQPLPDMESLLED